MNNSGYITNKAQLIDAIDFAKYSHGKISLVAQGGGQRGIFTSGVLDAFLLSNFDPFDEFYGTSAGALNVCGYLCRQPGLGKAFIVDLTTSSHFFNLFSYIRKKQFMDLNWALDSITNYPYKLDLDLGHRVLGKRKAFAAVTDANHFSDHYLSMLKPNWYDVMLATCAIPRLYDGEVSIAGRNYVDGGVSASIPVQEAWRRGSRSIIVIRTEPIAVLSDEKSDSITLNRQPQESTLLTDQWQMKLDQWRDNWSDFIQEKWSQVKYQESDKKKLTRLNGGRWLFGADDIYRLGHLFGDSFDASLADMLMVHYQTYSLTLDFLAKPPDDVFVLQIAPDEPLKSTSLLSDEDELIFDYEQGLIAGYRFVDWYTKNVE
ncbi:patatin family protein [Vibrio sp. 10N.286.49.B3]|uniref:patatin-like phospholipase family protein n=1 Tax=Vibrio sp. 10N.286.49.B3 TaxID=1880855 RepID=UPI000C82C0CF|nr:patatin-like phospholipase family protein [Vibrio sp. 10N.286.49.B3]PMH46792.1 patatin family protein [Vibrio sp. 10N.286.49.B3]